MLPPFRKLIAGARDVCDDPALTELPFDAHTVECSVVGVPSAPVSRCARLCIRSPHQPARQRRNGQAECQRSLRATRLHYSSEAYAHPLFRGGAEQRSRKMLRCVRCRRSGNVTMANDVSLQALSTLIASIYDCALDPCLWEQTVSEIKRCPPL